MSRTINLNGVDHHFKFNSKPRPVLAYWQIPASVRANNYMEDSGCTSELCANDGHIECTNDPHWFIYRGSVYDIHEFTVAGDHLKALGFDGVQGESYFSAVIVRWFDEDGNYTPLEEDGTIKVGYLHW